MASNRDRNQTATQDCGQASASIAECKYAIVPNGDTILSLKNPNARHCAWHEDPNRLAHLDAKPGGGSRPAIPVVTSTDDARSHKRRRTDGSGAPGSSSASSQNPEVPPVRMRLSSSHLKTASAYFEAMFDGPWAENERDPESSTYSITAEDWDESMLVLLMKIIHGRLRDVKPVKDWESLSKIASMVDYYQCHDVVKFYIQACLPPTQVLSDHKLQYNRTLVQRLAVLCTFELQSRRKEISLLLSIIAMQARGPMQTMGLPIPATMTDTSRRRALRKIFDRIYGLLEEFRLQTNTPPQPCATMQFGVITQHLHTAGLLFTKPTATYEGVSWRSVRRMVARMQSPSCGLAKSSSEAYMLGYKHAFLDSKAGAFLNIDDPIKGLYLGQKNVDVVEGLKKGTKHAGCDLQALLDQALKEGYQLVDLIPATLFEHLKVELEG